MEQNTHRNLNVKVDSSDARGGYFPPNIIEEIDKGWRYFWKKRGYEPPPSFHKSKSNNFLFGKSLYEAKSNQKEKGIK